MPPETPGMMSPSSIAAFMNRLATTSSASSPTGTATSRLSQAGDGTSQSTSRQLAAYGRDRHAGPPPAIERCVFVSTLSVFADLGKGITEQPALAQIDDKTLAHF